MAVPTIDPVLTNVTLANDLTGWAGFNDGAGGAGSDVLEEDIFIQGVAAVSKKVSGSGQDQGLIYTPGGATNLTADADKHVYAWIAFTTHGILNTIALGGLYLRLEDSGGNWSKWYLDGSDTIPAEVLFKRYVIDTSKTESENSGTPVDLTDVTIWGVGVKSTGNSKSENLIVDRIDFGTGLRIEDGEASDECNWAALFADDDDINNKYGIITQRSGVFYLLGALDIGDPASKTTLWLDESGATVVFENPLYYNGAALVSAISADLYAITFQGNGTGTTDIDFGGVIGAGDDRQGIGGGVISTAGPRFTIDGETDIADLDTVNLYGMTLTGAGVTKFSGSTKTDIIGCTFAECDEVQPNDAEFLNNTVIAPSPDRGVEMVSGHNIKQVGFIAGADVDIEHHVHIPVAGTYGFDALKFFGFAPDGAPKWHAENSSAGLVTIEATNDANPTEAEVENTGGGSVVVDNPITFTVADLVTGSEVRIFTDPGGVELAGVESSGTSFAYAYNYSGDINIYVIIQNVDYVWQRRDDTLTNDDKTIDALQVFDPNYLSP
jgi:hypothetical protein